MLSNGGGATVYVTRSAASCCRKTGRSSGWCSASSAPLIAHGSSMPPMPAMFTTGNGHRIRSSAVIDSRSTWKLLDASHIAFVRGTPLGVPVVPEVQQIVTTSSGSETGDAGVVAHVGDLGVDRDPVCRRRHVLGVVEHGQPGAGALGEDVGDVVEMVGPIGPVRRQDRHDVRSIEPVAQLVTAMLNRERHGDRAHPCAGQDAEHQFGDVRQLDRDGVTTAHTQAGQGRRQPIDRAVDLGPGQPERFAVEERRAVRSVDERFVVGARGRCTPDEVVEGAGLVAAGAAGQAHRTRSTPSSLTAGHGTRRAEQRRAIRA